MLIEKLGAMALIALTAYAYDGSLISRFGTTPGKAAFGLRVHGLGGAPLPAGAAFKRARIQLFSGLLLLFWFPMLQVINAFILRSRHGDHMPWDKDAHSNVYQRPIGTVRRVVVTGLAIMVLFGVFAAQQMLKQESREALRQTMGISP